MRATSVRFGLIAAADAACLVLLAPSRRLPAELASPHAWLGRVGPDAAAAQLAGATLWCAALWLAIGVCCAAAGRLPGAIGRGARRSASVLLPRCVYRLAAGAAGLGVLVAPVAAGAAVPTAPAGAAGPAAAARSASPAPAWPSDAPLPAPHWPAAPDPRQQRPSPPPAAVPAQRTARPAGRSADTRVQPGDSLWSIAAEHLGPRATPRRTAAAWPRWWAANRGVIGADPDRLEPGQILHAPSTGRTS